MATFPSLLDTSRVEVAQRPKAAQWAPALFAVIVICCESQKIMGGDNTKVWLGDVFRMIGEPVTALEWINHLLRKAGHFTGYGLLGLCFARGWMSVLRKRIRTTWAGLRLRSGAFGIASAFLVASCDEFHQSFLPGRTACFSDVMLDTCGALTVGLIAFGILNLQRRSLTHPAESSLTTLGLTFAGRVAHQFPVQRLRQSVGRRTIVPQKRVWTAPALTVTR